MLTHKGLIQLARKWRQMVKNSSIAPKGHIVLYSIDKRRFIVPVAYLSTSIFRELFKMAEELFGLPGDGPITLPCGADMMEQIILSHGRRDYKIAERALLQTIATSCHSDAFYLQESYHQILCSF